jgi:hypothetical protein
VYKMQLDFESDDVYSRFFSHMLAMPNGKGITITIPGTGSPASELSELAATDSQQPQVMPCLCTTKQTSLPNMRLLFVKRTCPAHGEHWQV